MNEQMNEKKNKKTKKTCIQQKKCAQLIHMYADIDALTNSP